MSDVTRASQALDGCLRGLPTQVFIGLGSNMHDPKRQLRRAIDALGQLPLTQLRRVSQFYANPPMGPQQQPDYVNAVAELGTRLAPLSLLTELQCIEFRHGRRSGLRWGQRCLDLDLLLYGQQHIKHLRLRVPHPGIADRAFVLVPLAELQPGLEIPGVGRVDTLLRSVADVDSVVVCEP